MKNYKMSAACLGILLIIITVSSSVCGQDTDGEYAVPFTRLFDTVTSSSARLSGEALAKKAGWRQLDEDETSHQFKGDIVFLNDKLSIVLRQHTTGAEVYSMGIEGMEIRAVLAPAAEGSTAKLRSVKIVENNPNEVIIDAHFQDADGRTVSLRYALQMGQMFVKTEALNGVKHLRLESVCRFVVMPDFFADDIVIDAEQIPIATAELPSENFIMHMTGGGEIIVMSVWENRDEDVRIRLSQEGDKRIINSSEIYYGKEGKIWVAIMQGRDIWHMREIAIADADKEIHLNWKQPFPAQWRVDWQKTEGDTSSWEMLAQKPNGEYVKTSWFEQPESYGNPLWEKSDRGRWSTELGPFRYPCWVNKDGQGYLQPLKKNKANLQFEGPAIIYPINRLKETPIEKFTVVDIVRATLGVGPCEYILDVEGQKKVYKGIPTCPARDRLNAIYEKKLQKGKKDEVKQILNDVQAFVQHIRGRVEYYIVFGHEMLKYLAEQKKAHPELAEFITEMETVTQRIDAHVARRKPEIKEPEYAVNLIEEFRTSLVDYDGDDALEKCKRITKTLTIIGDRQDQLVAECRGAVKALRQRAGLIMAVEPEMSEISREIRRRTQQALRNPASYEAAHH